MEEAMANVRTVELTLATRTVEIDGVKVRQGQIIGLMEGVLKAAGEDLAETFNVLLGNAGLEQSELVTIYYGVALSADQAKAVVDRVKGKHPHLVFELVDGGQPHYQLIASIE